MPTPSASPPRVIRFSVNPMNSISANVAMTLIGIALAMTRVLRALRRNARSTRTANPPP